jgi:Utp13 specific WD40 associated domain
MSDLRTMFHCLTVVLHCIQAVVASILRCFSLEKLCEVDGIADIVDGLLPYSERHYQRLDRYTQHIIVQLY